MQATAEQVQPEFKGSAKQKKLAEKVFEVTRGTARFFSPTSAISVPLSALSDYLAKTDGTDSDSAAESIEAALKANDHIFAREVRGDDVYFLTTRSGLLPREVDELDSSHSFASRFSEPPAIPDTAPPSRRSRSGQGVSDAPVGAAENEVESAADLDDFIQEVEAEPAQVDEKGAPAAADDVEVVTNLDDATDEEIVHALRNQLAYEYSVANFGDEWMAEDKAPRLSRGDIRRIKDYISEQNAPVSDHQIVQDLLGIRQSAQEYSLHLFAVNFRLSRETRDFEFVGIPSAHFWTTAGIATPEVVNRKASEVGQDYRILLDLEDAPSSVDEGVVEHVLTFYEHRHGVLPYDATFASIIPGPVLTGQRAAIVQFESPLTNQSFPIEVRFPTGSRGGFLAGFGEFFKEHLVPGAFATIEASEQAGTYTIEFLTVSGQDRKLLSLDEKKQQYKFESTTFYCAPNEDMLVAENRFPKLAGAKPLDDRTRRQLARVLAHAFNFVGERLDSEGAQVMAVMDELVAAANIERPMPAELIRSIASSDNHSEFSLDPEADDVVYYQPGTDTEPSS